MNPSPSHSPAQSHAHSNFSDYQLHSRSTVSWGAIFAGAVAALALHVLFMMLIGGLGLVIYSPITEDNPVANLSIGALIIHSICAIIALCLGGMVAGGFSPVAARATGWIHGFCVWSAATVGGVIMVALGVGAMMGGLTKLVGGGLSAIGQPAAEVAGGVAELASDAVNQNEETITSFVNEAVGSIPEDRATSEEIRATREVGMALNRLFNPAQEGNTAANRNAAVSALAEHTQMSQAEADRRITEWTASYERLQSDLAEAQESATLKTREAADSTSDALAKFSLWSFVGSHEVFFPQVESPVFRDIRRIESDARVRGVEKLLFGGKYENETAFGVFHDFETILVDFRHRLWSKAGLSRPIGRTMGNSRWIRQLMKL